MINEKKIFTFWEPKDEIPAYIELCIETWRKFLGEYEIVILDYSNYRDYIGNFYDESLEYNFSLPKQADAIRAAVLARHGGVWLDADTIILSSDVEKLFCYEAELVMLGRDIGFLAAKENSRIPYEWASECQKRILEYNISKKQNKLDKKMIEYNYLGNGIVDGLVKKYKQDSKTLISINQKKEYIYPERNFYIEKEIKIHNTEAYKDFYFVFAHLGYVLEHTKYILMLHNSWTPLKYKIMNKDEFLSADNTLSALFRHILNYKKTEIKTSYDFVENTEYYSAKTRIKNSLPYKLGATILESSHSFLGILGLPFVLRFVVMKHLQKQVIYKDEVRKNPRKKLPALSLLADYKDTKRFKSHLSYKLGLALIESYKKSKLFCFFIFAYKAIKILAKNQA